jgi:hypothetical protein
MTSPGCPLPTFEYADDRRLSTHKALAMALTQTQLLAAVADRAEFTKADTKRVLDAL